MHANGTHDGAWGDETAEFIVEMSRALCAHGTPAHRLENAMSTCAERLGVHAEFFATPTAVFCSIGEGRSNVTRLVRVEGAELNLDRLTRLDAIVQRVSSGEIDPGTGRAEIRSALVRPGPWPIWLQAAATGVAASTAGRFFGGGWREVAGAAAAGCVVGLLFVLAARLRRLVRVFEFVAGVVVALLAGAAARLAPGLDADTVIVSGLIVLIPGLSLTIAVSEIATRNLVAGAARLIGAATVLATIAFGVAAGGALVGIPEGTPDRLPGYTEWIALLAAPAALTVLFNARAGDMPAIAAVSVAGFLTARAVGAELGTELGVGAGALAVGLLSNARAIRANKPVAVCAIPGIMLLVPGAIGFRSLAAFLEEEAVRGLETAVLAVVVALALATGLLLANVLAPPSRSV
jgi:uncharacterized membrane protein YjjP (DUF1212 family)